MRIFSGILLLVFLLGCSSPSDKKSPAGTDSTRKLPEPETENGYIYHYTDTILENRITDTLMKLSFIKKADKDIDSFTNHRHGISFILDSLHENETEISVQAGYNGDDRFETYYRFYVNPKSLEIKIYDLVNDKKLSVKDYMKSKK